MPDNKTLATFRLDVQLWEAFKAEAVKNGTNASAVLIAYCRDYVSGASRQLSSRCIDENTSTIDIDNLDICIDKRVQDAVAEARDQVLRQTNHLLSEFTQRMEQQQQQIERLEAELMGETLA